MALSSTKLQGKVSLVIGGTSGIGKGFCEYLAQHGSDVIVAGRNRKSGDDVIEIMRKVAPQETQKFAFMPIDCYLVGDTRRFAREFEKDFNKLDYLVLSPGIATMQGRTETSEGLDQKLAIHYFTRVSLIDSLLPLLNKTAESEGSDVRILSVFSAGVHSNYSLYKDDVELKQNYTLKNAADAAGFYNDIALDSLAREHPKLTFVHAAPGFVATNWGTELSFPLRMFVRAIQVFGKTPMQCVQALSPALISPELKGGFHPISPRGTLTKTASMHGEAREFVWQQTKLILERIPKSS